MYRKTETKAHNNPEAKVAHALQVRDVLVVKVKDQIVVEMFIGKVVVKIAGEDRDHKIENQDHLEGVKVDLKEGQEVEVIDVRIQGGIVEEIEDVVGVTVGEEQGLGHVDMIAEIVEEEEIAEIEEVIVVEEEDRIHLDKEEITEEGDQQVL
ncbi:MAG: hypothetical protein VXZ35_04130 [Pseudomonadota bacterium]|nr:hypothetical protein [Pseudomonadota bacterium]